MRRLAAAGGLGLAATAALLFGIACSGTDELILATTTSTQDSGLLDVLIPEFEKVSGYRVKTIAVGSGQALRLGEEGEADVLLVHSPEAEAAFMDAGHGVERSSVMHNDFVIVGPPDDPAGIAGISSAADALSLIAQSGSPFLSRGDMSGTHAREFNLWLEAGIAPAGSWYQETGQGMGQTLLIANEKRGYTLTDRGTYLAQIDNLSLEILTEGDANLFNPYHVIIVDPGKSSRINEAGARAFAAFITSAPVQETIRTFGIEEYGQSLFVPDAEQQP
ncbi:MAG: substrate-binding domain-containing protein [Dehalococcoidia bacterium]